MTRLLGFLVVLFLSFPAVAANRPQTWSWTPPDETVDGDLLDEDGDGIREGLVGYRLYLLPGVTAPIETLPNPLPADAVLLWDLRDNTLTTNTQRINVPWGRTCYAMTALGVNDAGGEPLESAGSNFVCRDLFRGPPRPPRGQAQ